LAMVEISFKFHKGIHFDNLDDLFDNNFLPQIPPFAKGGLGGIKFITCLRRASRNQGD